MTIPRPISTTATNLPTRRLRIVERDVQLPGSPLRWRFQVAESRDSLDAQISVLRRTLVRSFAALGARPRLSGGAAGALRPLAAAPHSRGRSRRSARARKPRIEERLPAEIEPLTEELNALLEHNEVQAEEARRHAGNLAHALKTPLTVITNAATAQAPDLADTVCREATTMRRQVDHHLARARAVGRRASAHSPCGGVADRSKPSSARSADSTNTRRSISPATRRRRCGSSGRIWTRCSAISSRMPPNMAAAACS